MHFSQNLIALFYLPVQRTVMLTIHDHRYQTEAHTQTPLEMGIFENVSNNPRIPSVAFRPYLFPSKI